MKIIALWNNYSERDIAPAQAEPLAVCWLTDSCLLRERRPFYVPGFDTDFRLFPSLAIRIDRLGKRIEPRFVKRYWNEVSLWLNARACNLSAELAAKGLPQANAVSFDCSLVASPFWEMTPVQCMQARFTVSRNGMPEQVWDAGNLLKQPDEAISEVSRHNTLKTGDIFLLGFPEQGVAVKPGDSIQVRLDAPGEPKIITEFKIK